MPGYNLFFRIQSQMYHHMGSVVPSTRESPKFGDTDNQELQVPKGVRWFENQRFQQYQPAIVQ